LAFNNCRFWGYAGSMKIDWKNSIGKFNLGFIAIVLIFFAVSHVSYVVLVETYRDSGTAFYSLTMFSWAQYASLFYHPVIYLCACALYYAVSLRLKTSINQVVNAVLLSYFLLTLYGWLGPWIAWQRR
jgi:hypothetical protein